MSYFNYLLQVANLKKKQIMAMTKSPDKLEDQIFLDSPRLNKEAFLSKNDTPQRGNRK
jgi:hypothetical protein